MAVRSPVTQFTLANPLYKNASVSFYTVAAGAITATLANLYASTIGAAQLSNPQKLNSRGQFKQPVYIQDQVIGEVSGISVPSHVTPIISPAPLFQLIAGSTLQYSYDSGLTWVTAGTVAISLTAANITFDDTTVAGMFTNRVMRCVDTLAELAALNTTEYTRAFVLGSLALGDGLAKPYWFDPLDASTPDGVLIVQPNVGAGRWKQA